MTGNPVLTLSNGATASYDAANSTPTSLLFNYTVAAGQDSTDLTVGGLILNGATIAVPATVGFASATSYAAGSNSNFVAAADLDGDLRPDLVVANYNGRSVDVLLNNGSGGFPSTTSYAAGSTSNSVAVADLDGDLRPDLVVANYNGRSVDVLLNNGSGDFPSATSYVGGSYSYYVAVADVNGDTYPDLVVANFTGRSMDVLLNNGSGRFPSTTSYAAGSVPGYVAVADVNGDTHPDLVFVNEVGNGVDVLLSDGLGSFRPATSYAAGSNAQRVVVADVDGDSHPDLVFTNDLSSTVDVLLNDGLGLFSSTVSYTAGSYPYAIAVADVDGDGHPDIVVGDLSGHSVDVLLNNGLGSFKPATSYAAGSYPTSVAVADVNGDGRPDLVVATPGGGSVGVLLNSTQSASTFASASASSSPGTNTGLVIDTTPPTISAALVADTGSSTTDGITNNPALSGTAEAGGTVTIGNGTSTLATITAASDGSWSYTPTGLTDGTYTLTAAETDAAGNTGTASVSFTLDTTAPSALAISSPVLTNVAMPTLTGTAEPGSGVTLYEGQTSLGTTTVAQDGTWSFTAERLAEGLHQITASITDRAGNTSPPSPAFALTVDTTPPNVTAVLLNDTGSSAADRITSEATLTGSGDPNAMVTIGEGTTILGTTVADAQGNWTFAPNGLAPGVHNLVASETDAAGNTSTAQIGLRLDAQSAAAPADFITVGSTNVGLARFFDLSAGTQFYTSSLSEYNAILATRPDLKQEGNDLHALNPNTVATDPDAVPVYRFFDRTYGTHFFTASATERDNVIASRPDMKFEGVGFFEHTTQQVGDTAVYRFFDSRNGTHFYTTNETEKSSILTTRPDLVSEGIGFYAPKIG